MALKEARAKARLEARNLAGEDSQSDTDEAEDNAIMDPESAGVKMIGAYTLPERRERIKRFLKKRKQRVWNHKVKYDCRKKLADNRPRFKGRFVRRCDVPAFLAQLAKQKAAKAAAEAAAASGTTLAAKDTPTGTAQVNPSPTSAFSAGGVANTYEGLPDARLRAGPAAMHVPRPPTAVLS